MNIRTTLITSSLIAASLVSGVAHAVLQGRDLNGSIGSFEAYYDTDLDITWLANGNVNGRMNWAAANTWAANLSFYNPVTNKTLADWRLPTVNPINGTSFNRNYGSVDGSTDIGYNISEQGTVYAGSTANEMAHLFYNTLNNKAFYSTVGNSPQPGWELNNTGLFNNLQAGYYWSGTEYVPGASYAAWWFDFSSGLQNAWGITSAHYALAVSQGDVAAVPEAESYALMLAGLGLIGWRARRRG